MKNYYQILGVLATDPEDKIKQAYRALAKKYHPDINSSVDAEKLFQEINEAYTILSNPETKAKYDVLLFHFIQQQYLLARSGKSEQVFDQKVSFKKAKVVHYKIKPKIPAITKRDKIFIKWFTISVLSFYFVYFSWVAYIVNHYPTIIKDHLHLFEVQKIDLRKRDITTIDSIMIFLKGYRSIDLSNNFLQELPYEIGDLKGLEALSVRNNQLKEIPLTIRRMRNLRWLDCSNNPISALPFNLHDCKKLEVIWAENCQIDQLPTYLTEMKQLKYISLVGNPISKQQMINLQKSLPRCKIWY